MIKSMTGYGRYIFEDEGRRISAEIRTVNNRYLNLNIHMDSNFYFLEGQIRRLLAEKINRGYVDLNLQIHAEGGDQAYKLNGAAFEDLLDQISQLPILQDKVRMDRVAFLQQISPAILMVKDMVEVNPVDIQEEVWEEPVAQAVQGALDELDQARAQEGTYLEEDLLSKLDRVEDLVNQVKDRAPDRVANHMKKLKASVKELLDGREEIDQALLADHLALYAQKVDIDEEMTRLSSHIQAFRQALQEGGPVGKRLDFIAQEMNREANTTAAKANDEKTSQACISLRTEIEKIREQIQNIE